jgi:hypothetical protein
MWLDRIDRDHAAKTLSRRLVYGWAAGFFPLKQERSAAIESIDFALD